MGSDKVDKNKPHSILSNKITPTIAQVLELNMARALTRPRVTPNSKHITGQYMMIEAIALAFGGYRRFAIFCAKHLNTPGRQQSQKILNWRSRGGVPMKYVYIYSELLGISPYALNYKGMLDTLPFKEHPPWPEVVSGVTFIPASYRNKIAARPPFEGYVVKG